MPEYFSPSGTLISSATVGIIDDPNYTIYVGLTGSDVSGMGTIEKPYKTPHRALDSLKSLFITQNGFATIKCGAGHYTFDSPIEIRHPQGERIGIRGEETKDYLLTQCSRFRSSHTNGGNNGTGLPAAPLTESLHGTSACRFYEAGVHLNSLDWETSGNKLAPDTPSLAQGIGVENGEVGDYVLVRDVTFAHEDNYDVVHNDWGSDSGTDGTATYDGTFRNKQSTHRTGLLGCHPIVSNDENSGVNYLCKYYNYPTMAKRASIVSDANATRPIWFGGWHSGAGSNGGYEWDFPSAFEGEDSISPHSYGQGDYYSNPWPCVTVNDWNVTEGWNYPTRYGNTAEGWDNEPTTDTFKGFSIVFGGATVETYHSNIRPSELHHCSLNRLQLTHIKTIFKFSDCTKTGVDISGGGFGFLQDLVLEGSWQQFKKHLNDNVGGNASNQPDGEYISGNGDVHAGIYVNNGGSFSYDLGITGGVQAITKFQKYNTKNFDDNDITIMNVGINGFALGVLVDNNSSAIVNDIVISNCATGIYSLNSSHIESHRSVVIGFEDYGLLSNHNSQMVAQRSIIGFGGYSVIPVGFYRKPNASSSKFRDSTFRSGDVIALVDTDKTGHVGETVGIVCTWSGVQRPGIFHLSIYDHLVKYKSVYTDNIDNLHTLINDKGLTLASESASSTSTVAEDTHPTTGYLTSTKADNTVRGTGVLAQTTSSIDVMSSLVGFCNSHSCHAGPEGRVNAWQCLAHNSWIGFRTQWGTMSAGDTKAMNMTHSAFRCSWGAVFHAQDSIAENTIWGWDCGGYGSNMHAPGTKWIEGRSRMVDYSHSVASDSTAAFGTPWFSYPAGTFDGNTWVANDDTTPDTNYRSYGT